MHFAGEMKRDGKFWMVEVPDLDIATQGKNKKDALFMIADVIETAVNHKGFKVSVIPTGSTTFVVTANDVPRLMALFMRRQREARGMTVRQVALAMRYKAHGAYSQYERGVSSPGIETLERFISAVNPDAMLCMKVIRPGENKPIA